MALAGKTALGKAGSLTGGGSEVAVAPAALATAAEDIGLAVGHILDDLAGLGIPDQSATGDLDGKALAVLAALAGAHTVHAVFGGVLALVAEIHQGGEVIVHLQDDMTAIAAVTAVGTTGGNVLLAVEGNTAVAAVAGSYGDAGFIDECCGHRSTSLVQYAAKM